MCVDHTGFYIVFHSPCIEDLCRKDFPTLTVKGIEVFALPLPNKRLRVPRAKRLSRRQRGNGATAMDHCSRMEDDVCTKLPLYAKENSEG